jgi:hypothetical protein
MLHRNIVASNGNGWGDGRRTRIPQNYSFRNRPGSTRRRMRLVAGSWRLPRRRRRSRCCSADQTPRSLHCATPTRRLDARDSSRSRCLTDPGFLGRMATAGAPGRPSRNSVGMAAPAQYLRRGRAEMQVFRRVVVDLLVDPTLEARDPPPGTWHRRQASKFFTTEKHGGSESHGEARILTRGAEASDQTPREVPFWLCPWRSLPPCFSVVKNYLLL